MIELVIGLVLLGATLTVVVPVTSTISRQSGLREARHEFLAAHSVTRSLAIRYGRVAKLHIDASAGRYWVEVDTSAARTGVFEQIGRIRQPGLREVEMTSTRSLLCFDGRGLATHIADCPRGSATVVFRFREQTDTIVTSVAGKVLR